MDQDLFIIVQPLTTLGEGRRNKLYKCPAGKTTGGIGHNFDDKGIPDEVIDLLFRLDAEDAEDDCVALLGADVWAKLSLRRKAALVDMAFNLGRYRMATFTNTLLAIKQGKWQAAAHGMRLSRWAQQVGVRAERIATMIEKG